MSRRSWENHRFETELTQNILPYWIQHAVDRDQDGFYGVVSDEAGPDPRAEKSGILNARILWTFSTAYQRYGEERYRFMAQRAYHYMKHYFWDDETGGVFWMLDCTGKPQQAEKHLYVQSFALYGLTAYHQAMNDEESSHWAIRLFEWMERHGRDETHGGYIEAFSRKGEEKTNQLLGGPQAAPKSMNTHLHVLEAYTNLYRIYPVDRVKDALEALLHVMKNQVLHPEEPRFQLFFDESWRPLSTAVSFGHDIEGSWLLSEAADVLGDLELKRDIEAVSVRMAENVYKKGRDCDGSVLNEADGDEVTKANKVWWVQAEAVVGFYHAYQLSGEPHFQEAAAGVWRFICDYMIDEERGEWHRERDRDRNLPSRAAKVDPWKCPYHNGRACLEMIERLKSIVES